MNTKLQRHIAMLGAFAVWSSSLTQLRADLIGRWPLDGHVRDSSANGLHGELIGNAGYSSDVPDLLGGGLSLALHQVTDGGFEYVNLGNPDILNFSTNNWSVAAWFKVPEGPLSPGYIFSNGTRGGGGRGYFIWHEPNNHVELDMDDNIQQRATSSRHGFVVDDNDWHHVVGLREETDLRLYIDGALAALDPNVPTDYDVSGSSERDAYIGISGKGTAEFHTNFRGWIDDVAVFDHALTQSEILRVMNGDFSNWIVSSANASFDDSSELSSMTIDFGIVPIGSKESRSFQIANLIGRETNVGEALNLENFLVAGDANVLTTDLYSFTDLEPGDSKHFTASIHGNSSGEFSVNTILNFSNSFGDQQTLELTLSGQVSSPLQAGDVDQDFDFDQLDLVEVLLANKYLTGLPVTWGEGDWDGAPGGAPGFPPKGDGLFNQKDIVAALAPGHYLDGRYAAAVPEPRTLGLLATAMVILLYPLRRQMHRADSCNMKLFDATETARSVFRP